MPRPALCTSAPTPCTVWQDEMTEAATTEASSIRTGRRKDFDFMVNGELMIRWLTRIREPAAGICIRCAAKQLDPSAVAFHFGNSGETGSVRRNHWAAMPLVNMHGTRAHDAFCTPVMYGAPG